MLSKTFFKTFHNYLSSRQLIRNVFPNQKFFSFLLFSAGSSLSYFANTPSFLTLPVHFALIIFRHNHISNLSLVLFSKLLNSGLLGCCKFSTSLATFRIPPTRRSSGRKKRQSFTKIVTIVTVDFRPNNTRHFFFGNSNDY